MEEEVIYNRFVRVFEEWVAIHDEKLHFIGRDATKPQIKLCGKTLRVRANNEWTKLPKHLQEAMVAHELGHREMGHASIPQDNPFYRMGFVLNGGVDPKELEADRYACKLVAREEYIAALRELVTMEQERTDSNTLSIREFQYRIKALENTKQGEKDV